MLVRLVTAPTSEPVALGEAKAHLRLESDDDNDYVTTLITAARQWAEEYLWRGLLEQTWEVVLEEFPCGEAIELPKCGGDDTLSSITSLKYIDGDGVEQTWSSTNYVKDSLSRPGRLVLAYGKTWPSARSQWDAVKVRYVVGWTGSALPTPIKQGLLLLVSQMYEHRTPEVTGTIVAQIQFAIEALLRPYRLARY